MRGGAGWRRRCRRRRPRESAAAGRSRASGECGRSRRSPPRRQLLSQPSGGGGGGRRPAVGDAARLFLSPGEPALASPPGYRTAPHPRRGEEHPFPAGSRVTQGQSEHPRGHPQGGSPAGVKHALDLEMLGRGGMRDLHPRREQPGSVEAGWVLQRGGRWGKSGRRNSFLP